MFNRTSLTAALAAFTLFTGAAIAADATVELKINGEETVLTVDDLADGETRSYENGPHSIIVTRVGDELKVEHSGVEIDAEANQWIQADGTVVDLDGEGPHMMFITTEDGEGEQAIEVDVEVLTDGDIELEEGAEHKVFIKKQVVIDENGDENLEVEKQVKVLVKTIED